MKPMAVVPAEAKCGGGSRRPSGGVVAAQAAALVAAVAGSPRLSPGGAAATAIVFEIVEAIVFVTAVVQFILRVATGHPNERLRGFGAGMARYLREVVAFLTYDSDEIPYPFGPWPKA